MLENAVHPIPELRLIKTQAKQLETSTGKAISFDGYFDLLASAAQQYDTQLALTPAHAPRRRIYAAEHFEPAYDDNFGIGDDIAPPHDDISFDIDAPVTTL